MPFISPFSTLLCETLGIIQPLSTSRGFLFSKAGSLSRVKKNIDISLCGIVEIWLVNIMVLYDYSP
jgi:hypothetical protein